MRLEEERGTPDGFAEKIVEWLGAYLISFVGLLHLLLAGEHLAYAVYLGVLFLANFVASAVAAVGIARTGAKWAWLLGAAVAGGALVALLWSRIIGLPGFPDGVGQWFNFSAWMAVAFELPFLAIAPLALTSWGRALVRAEQGRVDRERLPPSRQETPEHFGQIEGEMYEIRDRMAPDVSDLRAHLEPRAIKERAKRDLEGRLRGARDSVETSLEQSRAKIERSARGVLGPAREDQLSRLAATAGKDGRPLAALATAVTVLVVARRMVGRRS